METQAQPAPPAPAPDQAKRLNRFFGPVVAGILIDIVDLETFGPIGLYLGLPIGGLAGYWMGYCLGLAPKHRWLCALAAGIYCTVPGTEMIPLATLVGAFAQYRESAAKPRDPPPPAP